MNVTECDNCRKLGPIPAPGWIVALLQTPQEQSFLSLLSGGSSSPGAEVAGTFCTWRCVAEVAGTFCTWRCVAEFAAVKALVPDGGQS